jgi:anti-sigma regulatory factor (Ser/Thr protein kinase)
MKKTLKEIIAAIIKRSGRITSEELAREAGVSRQAAHKNLSILVNKNELFRIGSTRGAYYTAKGGKPATNMIMLTLANKKLEEHLVLEKLERSSKQLKELSENAMSIFEYAFTEMLNNAIEHSRSKKITVKVYGEGDMAVFEVEDKGVGVYNNIMKKFRVSTELGAVQEILKGKRTTAAKGHSGEGIFFTEKISDHFELDGGSTALIVDNPKNDIAVKGAEKRKGTRVVFKLDKHATKSLKGLFNAYTDEEIKFTKTKVTVKLYENGVDYVSRSQARRVIYGLEKFSTIILDFKGIKGIGQGFADEIFRVYSKEHPKTKIIPQNASNAVLFMIKRAAGAGLQ